MDSREGSKQPVIVWAVMTLWRALLSAAVQLEYHAKMVVSTFDSGVVEGHHQTTLQVVFLEYSTQFD